ncbi:hypothetical protein ACHAW6_009520 [Cyclotella cf. meneghiniana]
MVSSALTSFESTASVKNRILISVLPVQNIRTV